MFGLNSRTKHPLRALDLFAGCSEGQLKRAEALLTELRIPAGKVLFQQGGYGAEFVIILEGAAIVTSGERVLATVGPGDFVGEISLLRGTERSADVTALTDLVVVVCHPGEFRSLLDEVPSLADNVDRVATIRGEQNQAAA